MSVVRIGIIGVGVMGSAHVNSVKQLKNCELTALCDIDPKVLERYRESGVELFSDSEALFASGKVDGVIISTPHYFHVPLALRAMEHGIHVLVEKPIAVQKSEAERLVAASVVDEDELVVLLHGGHHLRQPAIALADDLFLIVEGNDDRDERFHETMGASGSNRINSTPASFKISLEKSSGYSCR